MRFGRDLHHHHFRRSPSLADQYVPYQDLKAGLKLALRCPDSSSRQLELAGFYRDLAAAIARLSSTCIRKQQLLVREEQCIVRRCCSPAGSGTPRQTSPSGFEVLAREIVEGIQPLILGIREKHLEVLAFLAVNREALRRLGGKLERAGLDRGAVEGCRVELGKDEVWCLEGVERLDTLLGRIVRDLGDGQMDRKSVDKVWAEETAQFLSLGASTSTLSSVLRHVEHGSVSEVDDAIHCALHAARDNGAEDASGIMSSAICAALAIDVSLGRWDRARVWLRIKMDISDALLSTRVLDQFICLVGAGRKFGLREQQPSDVEILASIIRRLGSRYDGALRQSDATGRSPLHYAALFGLDDFVRVLLEHVPGATEAKGTATLALLSPDDEGLTPLHLSIANNDTDIATTLLDVLRDDDHRLEGMETRLEKRLATLESVLLTTIWARSDSVATVWEAFEISRGDTSTAPDCGVLLRIAAHLGSETAVKMLLDFSARNKLDVDSSDPATGLSALSVAAKEGHLPIMEALLKAGADATKTDRYGWTARDHAAFRGDMRIAMVLHAVAPASVPNDSIVTLPMTKREKQPKYTFLGGTDYLIVNLGTMQNRKHIEPVDFSCCPPGLEFRLTDPRLCLEVSVPGRGAGTSRLLELCLPTDFVDETLVFPLAAQTSRQLLFRLFRKSSADMKRGSLCGIGAVMLEDENERFGAHRDGMIRRHTVPLTDVNSTACIAKVTFTYVIAKSFDGLETPTASFDAIQSSSASLIGHRGSGMNMGKQKYLQLGENTVQSFLSAADLGAKFVEFDVQMTRDLVPVIYHDYSMSETGTDVPVHELTLTQFLHASDAQPSQPYPPRPEARPRSRSLDASSDHDAANVQNRLKHTLEFTTKGFKQNTRGAFIHCPLTTLEEVLRALPPSISLDIELKYPRLHEALLTSTAPVAIDLNTYLDATLALLARFAGPDRHIFLSSFSPEICILLQLKQRAYPVLLITLSRTQPPMLDREKRQGSVQSAVRFARQWGLAGIVFVADVCIVCPTIVRYVRERQGLVVGSFGVVNNEPGNVEAQVSNGVGLIVADRVGVVAGKLRDMREASG